MPEGGRRAITNINESDGAIGRQFVTNNLPQIGRGRSRVIRKNRVIEEEPIFPWSLSASEELINKFKQQTSILSLQVFKPKTTLQFTSTDMLPSYKALRTVASIVSSPEESATSPVNSVNHSFVETHSSHIVKGDSTEDR
jgi:hypothetical protein